MLCSGDAQGAGHRTGILSERSAFQSSERKIAACEPICKKAPKPVNGLGQAMAYDCPYAGVLAH